MWLNFVLVQCQFVFSEAFNCLEKERLQIFSSFLGSWQRWLEESCSKAAVQFFVGAIHEKKGSDCRFGSLGSRFFGLLDWFLSLYMVLGCLLF
jgi:hypothetical protein